MDCIFCKIAAHLAEARIVYEDDSVIAFLAKDPISEGHTLVIPKQHFENLFDIEPSTLEKISLAAKNIARTYRRSLGIDAVNLLNASGKSAQQSVFHFHLHIVPRHENDGLDLWFLGGRSDSTDQDKVLERIKKESISDSSLTGVR
jgi:diadenosine tetraphosphate (Ap4A) HIT family hydrolase